MTFYIYKIGNNYIRITPKAKAKPTPDIRRASYWEKKKQALSWMSVVMEAYPMSELKEAKLVEI